MEGIGGATDALYRYSVMKNAVAHGKSQGMPSSVVDQNEKEAKKEVTNATAGEIAPVYVKPTPPDNNNPSSPKTKQKGEPEKQTKQEFDWLQRYIDAAAKRVDILKSKLQNLFSIGSKNNNLTKQIKELYKELNGYNRQAKIYQNKADSYGEKI